MGPRRRQAVHHERRPGGHLHRHRPDRRRRDDGDAEISAFIVPADTPGFSVGRLEEKLGLHASATGELLFDGAPRPGREPARRAGRAASRRSSRSSTAAGSRSARSPSGSPRRALDASIPYAQTREQFGRPIGTFQGVAFMIADMATEIEAARAARLARRLAQGPGPRLRPRRGRRPSCSPRRSAQRATNAAIQIHGGYGYVDGVPGRALPARREADRDRRGDEPGPAARHRPPDPRPARRLRAAQARDLGAGAPSRPLPAATGRGAARAAAASNSAPHGPWPASDERRLLDRSRTSAGSVTKLAAQRIDRRAQALERLAVPEDVEVDPDGVGLVEARRVEARSRSGVRTGSAQPASPDTTWSTPTPALGELGGDPDEVGRRRGRRARRRTPQAAGQQRGEQARTRTRRTTAKAAAGRVGGTRGG